MVQQVVVLYCCCPVQFCCFCLSLAVARGGGGDAEAIYSCVVLLSLVITAHR